MCLLAIHFRSFADSPLAAAANREEFFNRASLPPRLLAPSGSAPSGSTPRVLCGVDALAGGTWLGVNERGLFVAVTNRRKSQLPPAPRSRGQLCLDLLGCRSAEEAGRMAAVELATGRYAGANFVCADAETAEVIHAGDRLERRELAPGLHLIANGDLDEADDLRLALARELFAARPAATAADFLAAAQQVCGHYVADASPVRPSIVLRGADRGTVSSTLVSLAADPEQAVYRYAAGSPDRTPFTDYSQLLRSLCDGSAK